MKIVAGKFKGRTLSKVKGKTRPTPEKIREALFDILGDVSNLSFMDLYAGCGAVGFEALSRGVDKVTFIESYRKACRVINSNMINLELTRSQVDIMCMDVIYALKLLGEKTWRFNLVFADPPYLTGECERLINHLDWVKAIIEDGYFILQAHRKEKLRSIDWEDIRKYGDTNLYFYSV